MAELKDLFLLTLQDMYHGEKQILEALPKMVAAATSPELRAAFERHRAETADQIDRLEQVFELIGEAANGQPCEAIKGLVQEGEETMQAFEDQAVKDAGLIAAAQAIEHYEIARYGTLRAWAEQLDLPEAAALLEETLEEEKATDEILSGIALESANAEAAST